MMSGLKGLLDGSLNASDPDLAMIAQQNEKPAGIYVWCVHAPGVLAGGMPLTVEKISTKLYRDVDVYARAATVQGLQLMQTMGFEPNAAYGGITSSNVHVYRRSAPTGESFTDLRQLSGGKPEPRTFRHGRAHA